MLVKVVQPILKKENSDSFVQLVKTALTQYKLFMSRKVFIDSGIFKTSWPKNTIFLSKEQETCTIDNLGTLN